MLVPNFDNPVMVKVNVFLRDGTQYLGKNIKDQVHSPDERFVMFWDDKNVLIMIPTDRIKSIHVYEDTE